LHPATARGAKRYQHAFSAQPTTSPLLAHNIFIDYHFYDDGFDRRSQENIQDM
jgi:hypothetical protein